MKDLPQTCAWTDDMVAFFLDGCLEPRRGKDAVDASALDQHRSDCDICALALNSARRLDALVASTASTEPSPEVVDRWFSAVAAVDDEAVDGRDPIEIATFAVAPAESSAEASVHRLELRTERRRALRPVFAAAAALLVMGSLGVVFALDHDGLILSRVGSVMGFAPDASTADSGDRGLSSSLPLGSFGAVVRGGDDSASSAGSMAAADVFDPLDPRGSSDQAGIASRPGFGGATIYLSSVRRPFSPPVASYADLESSAARADAEAFRHRLYRQQLLTAMCRSTAFGVLRSRSALSVDARHAAAAERMVRLERCIEHGTLGLAIDMVERWPDLPFEDSGLSAAVSMLRGVREVRSGLRAALDSQDDGRWRVAVMVGDGAIDEALVREARGGRAHCDRIAAALAQVDHRPDRAWLLLRLWVDSYARGNSRCDQKTAYRWFSSQPADCTAQLLDMLASRRHPTMRRMCLLALAAREDVAASGALIELLDTAADDEAQLAAFALGCCGYGDDGLLQHIGEPRREHLRFAALASRRADTEIAEMIEQANFSVEQRGFLLKGHFDESHFATAAELLRSCVDDASPSAGGAVAGRPAGTQD